MYVDATRVFFNHSPPFKICVCVSVYACFVSVRGWCGSIWVWVWVPMCDTRVYVHPCDMKRVCMCIHAYAWFVCMCLCVCVHVWCTSVWVYMHILLLLAPECAGLCVVIRSFLASVYLSTLLTRSGGRMTPSPGSTKASWKHIYLHYGS